MPDSFKSHGDAASAPSRKPFAIVPHDSNELTNIPKAIYVGTAGTIVLRGIDASADVTFINVASGQILDVRAQYLRATGTTAANLIGLA